MVDGPSQSFPETALPTQTRVSGVVATTPGGIVRQRFRRLGGEAERRRREQEGFRSSQGFRLSATDTRRNVSGLRERLAVTRDPREAQALRELIIAKQTGSSLAGQQTREEAAQERGFGIQAATPRPGVVPRGVAAPTARPAVPIVTQARQPLEAAIRQKFSAQIEQLAPERREAFIERKVEQQREVAAARLRTGRAVGTPVVSEREIAIQNLNASIDRFNAKFEDQEVTAETRFEFKRIQAKAAEIGIGIRTPPALRERVTTPPQAVSFAETGFERPGVTPVTLPSAEERRVQELAVFGEERLIEERDIAREAGRVREAQSPRLEALQARGPAELLREFRVGAVEEGKEAERAIRPFQGDLIPRTGKELIVAPAAFAAGVFGAGEFVGETVAEVIIPPGAPARQVSIKTAGVLAGLGGFARVGKGLRTSLRDPTRIEFLRPPSTAPPKLPALFDIATGERIAPSLLEVEIGLSKKALAEFRTGIRPRGEGTVAERNVLIDAVTGRPRRRKVKGIEPTGFKAPTPVEFRRIVRTSLEKATKPPRKLEPPLTPLRFTPPTEPVPTGRGTVQLRRRRVRTRLRPAEPSRVNVPRFVPGSALQLGSLAPPSAIVRARPRISRTGEVLIPAGTERGRRIFISEDLTQQTPAFRVEQLQRAAPRIAERVSPVEVSRFRFREAAIPTRAIRQDIRVGERLAPVQIEAAATLPATAAASAFSFAESSAEAVRLDTRVIEGTVTRARRAVRPRAVRPRRRVVARVRVPELRRTKLPRIPFPIPTVSRGETRKRKGVPEFETLVRRGGEFFRVGKAGTFAEAVRTGSKETRFTLARTFITQRTGRRTRETGVSLPSLAQFRRPKGRSRLPSGAFVELAKFSLTEEQPEIQATRKRAPRRRRTRKVRRKKKR